MPTAQQFQLSPEKMYGHNYSGTNLRTASSGYLVGLCYSVNYPTFNDAANHEYGGASNIWEGPAASPYNWPYYESILDDNLATYSSSIINSVEYAQVGWTWNDTSTGSYAEVVSVGTQSFSGGTVALNGNYINIDITNPSSSYRYYYGFVLFGNTTSGSTAYPICRWMLDDVHDTTTDGPLAVKIPARILNHPNTDVANNMFSWDDVSYWYFSQEPSMPINWDLEARLVNDTFDMSTSAHLATRADKWTAVTDAAVTGATAYVFTEGSGSDLERPSYNISSYTGLEGKQNLLTAGMSFGTPTAGQTVNGLVIYVDVIGSTFWPVAYCPMTPFVTDGNPVNISMDYIFCTNKWNE